jgi:hypothetical protein
MFVTTTLVTGCDVTVVIATRFLMLRFKQRRVRLAFVQVIACDLHHATLAR